MRQHSGLEEIDREGPVEVLVIDKVTKPTETKRLPRCHPQLGIRFS